MRFLSAFVLSILFLGCAPKTQPIRVKKSYPQLAKGEAFLPSPFTTALWNAPLGCSEGSHCPESIGLVAFTEDSSIGSFRMCTGFLVADDMVATNSHCIPQTVKIEPELCSSYLAIKFFTDDGKGDVYSCDQFVFASEIYEPIRLKYPDYAFFRIRPIHQRRPYRVSREGFQDGQVVSVYSMQPRYSHPGGFLVRRKCTVSLQSWLEISTPMSPTLKLVGEKCTTQPGNSGSPIFTEDEGAVLGLMYSGVEVAQDVLNEWKVLADLPKRFLPAKGATNFACLRLPEPLTSSLPMPEACSDKTSPLTFDELERAYLKNALEEELRAWSVAGPHPLRFHLRPRTTQMNSTGYFHSDVYVDPVCLAPRQYWPKSRSLFGERSTGTDRLSVQYTEPHFVFRMAMQENYSVVPHKVEQSSRHFGLELSLPQSNMSAPIPVRQTFEYEGSVVRTQFAIHWCSEEEMKDDQLWGGQQTSP